MGRTGKTFDGIPMPEALRKLEEEGADVVSLNCSRGPRTMIPLIAECRKVCKVNSVHKCFKTMKTEKGDSYVGFAFICASSFVFS